MKSAVLGVGRMGRRHIQVIHELGWDLVGVFDVSQDSLKLAQEEQSVPAELLYSDIDTLFSKGKPECVIIATTADSHCALTCMAAERGAKFILVEKPMAVSLEQCDIMIETCRKFGTKLAVNHQMRFMEQYARPKELLTSEDFGGLASMTLVAGNIGFSMNASHYFEAFRYIAEEAPVEVTAWFSPGVLPNPRGPQFQDRAGSIRVTTASGKRLTLEIGSDQGYGLFLIYTGRYGMITVNEINAEMISAVREKQYRDIPTNRVAMPAVKTQATLNFPGVIVTTAAVLNALVEDKNSVSGEDGRKVVEVLVAAYQSAESASIPVRIDERLDRQRVFPWA